MLLVVYEDSLGQWLSLGCPSCKQARVDLHAYLQHVPPSPKKKKTDFM